MSKYVMFGIALSMLFVSSGCELVNHVLTSGVSLGATWAVASCVHNALGTWTF